MEEKRQPRPRGGARVQRTSMRMLSLSRGLWGDMDEGLARLEEEGEMEAGEEGEEEGWWLCWIRSGRR